MFIDTLQCLINHPEKIKNNYMELNLKSQGNYNIYESIDLFNLTEEEVIIFLKDIFIATEKLTQTLHIRRTKEKEEDQYKKYLRLKEIYEPKTE